MKQKLFTLLLAFIAAISFAGAKDIASGTFKNGGTWKISDQGELYINAIKIPDYTTQSRNIIALDQEYVLTKSSRLTYGDLVSVTSAPWGVYSEKINTIRIGSAVTEIGKSAFVGMSMVKKVTCDARSTNLKIGIWAFSDCFRLETFDFTHVSYISMGAFSCCVNLKSNNFPALQSVEVGAFNNCTSLASTGFLCLSQLPSATADIEGLKSIAELCKAGDSRFLSRNSNFYIVIPASNYSTFVYRFGETPFASYSICTVARGDAAWRLNKSGTLTVLQATGDFASPSDAPWYSLRNDIKSVAFENTRSVGKNAFKGYTNLTLISTMLHYVGVSAFEGCTNLKTADLSEVKTIGASAFANTKLGTVDLNAATIIASNAFDGAPLQYIKLGASLQTIGTQAFRNTLKGSSNRIVVMGAAPTTPSNAFENVTAANVTLTVPANIANTYEVAPWNSFTFDRTIAQFPVADSSLDPMWRLFDDGTLLIYKNVPNYTSAQAQPWYNYREFIKKIKIASGVTSIGNYAFAFPTGGISKVTVIESYFDNEHTPIKTLGAHAFENNDQLTEVSLRGLETIGDQAFNGCTRLKSYTFGSNLQSIGSKAFNGCPVEATMSLTTPTPPTVSSTTFQGMGVAAASAPGRNGVKAASSGQKSVKLDVPDAHISKYLAAQYWNLFSFEYIGEHGGIVESGQAYDGMYVLYSDSTMIVSASAPTNPQNINQGFSIQSSTKPKIKRVEIQGTLEKLGYQFEQCPNLEEVVLGPTFTTLYGSFYQCPKLKSINLENVLYIRPNGVRNAFEGCTSLTTVNIPNALEVSGFKGCTSLASVTLGGNAEIESNTFENCTALTSIDLGNAKVSGAEACFSGCTGLASVKFSGTKIPDEFFKNCSALTTIDLGSQIEEIGESAFEGTGLQKIYIQRPSAPETHADAFKNLTVSNIQLYRPYAFRYGYRTGDWYDMDWMDDEDYEELDFPMYFSIGSNAVGMIDESENLFIDAVTGGTIVANANDYIAPYAPYILNEIHIGNDVTSLPAGTVWTGMFHWVPENASRNLVIGSGMESLGDYAFYNNGWDCDLVIDCYALTPPTMQGAHVFNWNKVQNGSQCVATLNVVNDPAVVAAYRADPYWSKFSIAGTLAPADAPTECTVTFVDWDGTVLQTTTTRPGMSVTPPEDPVRPGYEFRGWDSQEYGWVLTDLTITATYYEDMYTVRFYDFDGTRLNEQQVRHGQAAVAPADPAEREGYTYAGWSEDFSHVTMDMNICAVFNPIMFTVTFQDKDGSPLSTQQVQWGTAAVAPEAPEVEGYEFVGWDTDFSCVKTDLFVKAVYQEAVSNVVSYVCDFTAKKTNHQNYNDTWTYDTDWDVFGAANNNGQWAYAKFGGKSATLANANPVYVADNKAFGREIKQIRVTFPSGSFSKTGMSANEWGAKVYSDLACTQLLYTVTGSDIDANGCTLMLTPESGKPWEAGSVIRVYWDLANTTSTNGIVLVDKIEYLTASDDNRPLWVTATGIEDVSIQPSAVSSQKILHNGILYIIRPDGAIYNATGVRVK